MTNELNTYSFTEEDIDLITFALRRLEKETVFGNLKTDVMDLIGYIERLKKEMKKIKKPDQS